jgi:hypothetical protein
LYTRTTFSNEFTSKINIHLNGPIMCHNKVEKSIWLIDWCLKLTLAVFQLYCGSEIFFFYVLCLFPYLECVICVNKSNKLNWLTITAFKISVCLLHMHVTKLIGRIMSSFLFNEWSLYISLYCGSEIFFFYVLCLFLYLECVFLYWL